MKKILLIMASVAAIVAFASCKKDNGKDKKEGEEETEYVQPITIDGDFSDWAKLDASKIATAKCAPDATKTALKLVKVYADEYFVFVYFEWDKDQISYHPNTAPADQDSNEEDVPFHVYINGDGNAATGGFGDQWNDACTDVLMEGFLTDGTNIVSYEPGLFRWAGETNGTGWSWEDLGDISGICSGAGIVGKYELSIVRELYPVGKLADTFSIGFDIQQSWDSVGILPNAAANDDNPSGHTNSLQVTTVKAGK